MVRRILFALCVASPACTAAPNRLEQVSRENEAVAAAFGEKREAEAKAPWFPQAPPLTRHAVTLAPAPAGIDEALWREIGWFPADTTDISGQVDYQSQSLARWLESTVAEKFPVCAPLFGGIERTYLVQGADGGTATNIFYGAMTRAQERDCMQAALGAFEATGEQRGDMTILSTAEGPGVRLAWFGRDRGSVVILEGAAPLEGWMKPAGTLADQPSLVRLVAAVDRTRGSWSVGLRDYGTIFTGVASTGYMLTMTLPAASGERRLDVDARLEFASPKAAEEAERGAEAFMRDIPGGADQGIAMKIEAEGNWLRCSVEADLGDAGDEAITAWLQQVLVKVQARIAAEGTGR